MKKLDITQEFLCLSRIFNVLTARLSIRQKNLHVKGRHSDAFIFVTAGSCTYLFPEDRYSVTVHEGDILYLAHNAVYDMDVHTELYSSIYCDFAFLDDTPKRSDVFTPASLSQTETLFRRLLRLYAPVPLSTQAESMSLLYSIYGTILSASNHMYLDDSAKSKIRASAQTVALQFQDPALSVQKLAAQAGMSEVYFRKLFKGLYAMAPSQYILAFRLQKAKELMKYPFLTLEDCALQSGFSSLAYFSRVFKKETGLSPAKYRKENT